MGEATRLIDQVVARRAHLQPLVAGIEYGPAHWEPSTWVGEVSYYWFLAGLVQETDARRVFEAGTHIGGSARALAAGGAEVFTCDVEAAGRKALRDAPAVTAVVAPALEATHWCEDTWGSVDLVFIDVDHHLGSTLGAIGAALQLQPRWLVVDDISISDQMREAWRWVTARFPDAANTDDMHPEVRSGAGLGVVRVTD